MYRLGQACFITALDQIKGYWQIPLTPFSTPLGLFQFISMAFGLHGAPATFQRLMAQEFQPHHCYATAYLDDVMFYCRDWPTKT